MIMAIQSEKEEFAIWTIVGDFWISIYRNRCKSVTIATQIKNILITFTILVSVTANNRNWIDCMLFVYKRKCGSVCISSSKTNSGPWILLFVNAFVWFFLSQSVVLFFLPRILRIFVVVFLLFTFYETSFISIKVYRTYAQTMLDTIHPSNIRMLKACFLAPRDAWNI